MFALGKKSSAEVEAAPKAAKSSSKRSAKGSMPWKEWFIQHGEKLGLMLFVLITGFLLYDGLFRSKKYDGTKTPETLANSSLAARREIETVNHWNLIKDERPIPTSFEKIVKDALADTSDAPYVVNHMIEKGSKVSGEKRGDPDLIAPIELQGQCFVGAIAVNSSKPANIDNLKNAPPMVDPKKKREVPNDSTPARILPFAYDLGYQHKPTAPAPVQPTVGGRPVRVVENKVVPKVVAFNMITAAIPHQQLVDNYNLAFASATDFRMDRDTPNYLSYEVQRVDVTDNPLREIAENEWQDAPDCLAINQLKRKATWAGICDEVAVAEWIVDQILTMPIPPILISDYQDLASHPKILRTSLQRVMGTGEGDDSGDMGSDSNDTGDDSGMATVNPLAAAEDPAKIPKALPPTEFKLLRFADFAIQLGRTYRYRVRVAVEDPNYTRLRSWTPRTVDMKPEVVTRVQALEAADADAMAKQGIDPMKFERNSKRYTPWSEPTPAIVSKRKVELHGSQVVGSYSALKTASGKMASIESKSPNATVVYAEWKVDDGILVPRRTSVERGTVLSGPVPEPGLDVIHPITKVIKWLTGFRFADPVTVVDVRGGTPLDAEKRSRDRDLLPSGGEVVAFDPRTGDLIISREFEELVPFEMLSFAFDRPADGTQP